MKHLEDYFKTRKEVNAFFDREMFKFSFMSEGQVFFKSLAPMQMAGDYLNFQLSFYYEDQDFFNYSSFVGDNGYFDKIKLADIVCKDATTKKVVICVFVDTTKKK